MTAPQRFLEPREQVRPWSWSRGTADAVDDAEVIDPSVAIGSDASDVPGAASRRPPVDPDAPVFVISVAAEMSELHPQTLRAYERDGLLRPFRTPGGTRRYSRRDVERLRLIRRLTQDEGLNLAGVRLVLDLGEKLEQARRRTSELEDMVRTLAERLEQPRSDRRDLVATPGSGLELHRSSRRTGSRSSAPVQRARPIPPPDLRPDLRPPAR
jgi:MerR family transcriptional regulator/heat shock protein HspR